MPIDPEAMKQRMRTKRGHKANDPPAEPTMVLHRCGHAKAFLEIKNDRFRAERLAKEQARDCPDCRQARNAANQAVAQANKALKAKKAQQPRFPRETGLGCRFQLDYLEVGKWHGALIQLNDGTVLAEVDATSMWRTINALSAAYAAQAAQSLAHGPAQERSGPHPHRPICGDPGDCWT
jgi:hypothetical protein